MKLELAVKEYKEGNKEAFRDIYEESNRYIYVCIYKVLAGNDNAQDLVSDVMQDTYMEISRSICQLENCDKFLSWAGMIATRKCYAIVSKNKKYVLYNEDEVFEDIPDDYCLIPEEIMDNKEKQKIIRDIIDKELTPMQRLCIVAYYYNEQKQADIAKELNIPENTVKSNLSRAKQKIKEAVLGIEKKEGVKLYSFAPFMLLLLKDEIQKTVVPDTVTSSILGAGQGAMGSSVALSTGTKAVAMSLKAKIVAASIAVAVVALAGGGIVVADQIAREKERIEEEAKKEEKSKKNKENKKKADILEDEEIVETKNVEEIADVIDPDAWKQPYIEKVQDWQANHGDDLYVGYNLVYIDEDDVPELYLSGDNDEAWYDEYIYSSYDGELVNLHNLINNNHSLFFYYEGSGMFFELYRVMTNYYYGYQWKNGSLSDVVIYAETEYDMDENGVEAYIGNGWYIDENGETIEVTYSGNAPESINFPDEIRSYYNLAGAGSPQYLAVGDSMTYDEICEILGITDKVTPNPNNNYKRLLTDWYYGISNGYFTEDMGAVSSDDITDKQFAFVDINGDSIKELLVGGPGNAHLMLPRRKWEDAYVNRISYIDGKGALFSYCGYTFGSYCTIYNYDGHTVTEIYNMDDFDGSDLGEASYYTVNGIEVSIDEYKEVFNSFNFYEIDCEWYDLTEENINAIIQ